jgi:hypothetical protein
MRLLTGLNWLRIGFVPSYREDGDEFEFLKLRKLG